MVNDMKKTKMIANRIIRDLEVFGCKAGVLLVDHKRSIGFRHFLVPLGDVTKRIVDDQDFLGVYDKNVFHEELEEDIEFHKDRLEKSAITIDAV